MTIDAQEAANGDKDAQDRIIIGIGGSLAIDAAILAAILGARAAEQAVMACVATPIFCRVVLAEAAAKAADLLDEKGASQATGRAGGLARGANSRKPGDILAPVGVPIGQKGAKEAIREVTGDLSDAQKMFDELKQGGRLVEQNDKLTRYELPNGDFVQLRTEASKSPNSDATIDVKILGVPIPK